MVKKLHTRKQPSLLLNVGIACAFDSIAWPFLLDVLQHLGFPMVWNNWVSALLYTVHTKVLLNGVPGDRICHARGFHQGDPLSPMMFLLVMEVLSALIHKAESWSLSELLGVRAIPFQASLLNLVCFAVGQRLTTDTVYSITVQRCIRSGL
jgi:hypothetical protein